jgi:hypothetical protein
MGSQDVRRASDTRCQRKKPLTQIAKSTTAGIGFLLINRSERTILLSFGQARHQQPYPRVWLAQQLPQQLPTSI